MEAALKISGNNDDNKVRGLNKETAELIWKIISDPSIDQEKKDEYISTIERCSSTSVTGCTFDVKEVRKMSLWEMIHVNWLGGKPEPIWI